MHVLLAVVAIAVNGVAQQGQRLSAPPDPSAAFQWYRCAPDASHCASIHGAKAASYTLGPRDVGKTIALNVTAADGTALFGAAVGPVAAATAKLAATAQPAVTGDPVAGKTLTVGNGTWSAKVKGYTYAWLRCNPNGRICIAIAGATSSTYVPTADDVGHALAVRVTASNGIVAQPTLSGSTAVVTAASGPVASVAPSITGIAQQGQRLVAGSGTWTGDGAVTFAYQWYRCDSLVSHCSSIHGATGAGYKLAAADAGETIALTLKASDSAATVSVFLPAIGPVASTTATLVSTMQPKLTASTSKLTVDTGKWLTPPGTFAYTWLRCNANGRLCAPIAGATSAAYVPTPDDTGHSLVATVNGVLSTRS